MHAAQGAMLAKVGHGAWLQFPVAASCLSSKKHARRCESKLLIRGRSDVSDSGGGGSRSPSIPRPLLVPLPSLVDAKIVYAAVPALGHDQEGHPECAARVTSILSAIEDGGFLHESRAREVLKLNYDGAAAAEEVAAVHSMSYVRGLEKAMARARDEGMLLLDGTGPTYATQDTFSGAMAAAGAGLAVVDAVVAAAGASAGPPPVGFAMVRPPGHHALPTGPMGFCVFGNVALAARHVQRVHGLARVCIIDFDVHHGNGTQDMFFDDPSVFYLSTHQVGGFPGTGKMGEVGEGRGEGTTLNLPLPGGAGDEAVALVFEEVIVPAVQRFKPDMILVSAGYDAHYMDYIAGMQFTTATYHRLARDIAALARSECGGRCCFFLEGGYDLRALSASVADSFRAFLGEPSQGRRLDNPLALYEEPALLVRSAVDQIKAIHSL